MTIKLLSSWKNQPSGTLYTTDAITEAAMVAAKVATSDLTGAVAWVPPGSSPNAGAAVTATTDASGNVTGLSVGGVNLDIGLTGTYDVCVYGATPSGIMAAIAAKRTGAKVLLVEPTAWFGGSATGGVSHTDVSETQNKAVVVGLADELYRRIANDWYGISQNTFYTASYNAEPSVTMLALRRMLQESGVPFVTSSPLQNLSKTGTKITAASFSRVGVTARTWIDATYEGDMVAAAGCTVSIGREANALYSETHNGVTAIGAGAYQFPASVDPYVTAGVPASGLLPYVSSGSLAAAGSADGRCQAICLRLTITNVGGNKIPFPAPSNYNAANYELLGRAISAGLVLSGMGDIFSPTGLRGGKADLNNKACMSVDYLHPTECTEWVTATWERRAVIAENAKQYILGLIKFLQTDSRVTAGLKADLATYGLCADEYVDYSGITPQVYVREGRRLIGDYVMTENQLVLANSVTDPIAWGYYAHDSHPVQNVVVAGAVKSEGPNAFSPPIGVPISYKVLLPKAAECTNLAATFAMSVSRVAFCSFRMEPILMAMGHAAGIACAIAAARGVTLANVPYSEISAKQDIKQVSTNRAIVLDVSGTYTGGTYTETGVGSDSTSLFNYIGTKNRVGTSANATVFKFAPNITEAGQYGVYIRHSVASAVDASRTTNATLLISGADGAKTLTFTQQSAASSGDWDYYGDAYFNIGTPSANFVQITCAGSGSNTVLSAVKFVKRAFNSQPALSV